MIFELIANNFCDKKEIYDCMFAALCTHDFCIQLNKKKFTIANNFCI
uniref:Uncharacterized protein n=1 Tax=viral metagenome TaxID=1070528 RepID=A0A6C0C944_9ZZZZ